MIFVLIIAAWILIITIVEKTTKGMGGPIDPKQYYADVICPPHKWTLDTTGRLFCTACNRRPGEIGGDK